MHTSMPMDYVLIDHQRKELAMTIQKLAYTAKPKKRPPIKACIC